MDTGERHPWDVKLSLSHPRPPLLPKLWVPRPPGQVWLHTWAGAAGTKDTPSTTPSPSQT